MLSTTCGMIADDFRFNAANLHTHCQYEEQAQQNVDDKTLKQVCRVNDYSLPITSSQSITLVLYRKKLWILLPTTYSFLRVFAKLQKTASSFVMCVYVCMCVCMYVCPSVRTSAWNNSVRTGRTSIAFYIWVSFENQQKIQVSLQSDWNSRYFTWRRVYIYDNISLNYFQNEKCFGQML
jgi:hypothetical protein